MKLVQSLFLEVLGTFDSSFSRRNFLLTLDKESDTTERLSVSLSIYNVENKT